MRTVILLTFLSLAAMAGCASKHDDSVDRSGHTTPQASGASSRQAGADDDVPALNGPTMADCVALMSSVEQDKFKFSLVNAKKAEWAEYIDAALSKNESSTSSVGAKLGIPIEGIPISLDFSSNKQKASSLSQTFKSDSQSTLSEAEQREVLQLFTPDKAFDAVRDCIARATGAPFYISPFNDDQSENGIVTVRVLTSRANGVKVLSGAAIGGNVNDPAVFTAGTVFKNGDTFSVQRTGRVAVAVELASDRGRSIATFDALPVVPPIPPPQPTLTPFATFSSQVTDRYQPNFFIAAKPGQQIRFEIVNGDANTNLNLRQDRRFGGDRNYLTGIMNGDRRPANQYKDAFWQIRGLTPGKTVTINLYYE